MELRNQDFTVLGQGSSLTGDFVFLGPTRIAAQVDGTMTMEGMAPLTIERAGVFDGTLQCHDIEIYGLVKGKINSSGKITIFPSATVTGEVKCNDLVVFAGAQLNADSLAEKSTASQYN